MSVTLHLVILGLLLLCLVYCVVLLLKNNKICEYRLEALDIISHYASKAIYQRKKWTPFFGLYHSYPSYYKMLFDLTKWKYEDFYGDLENKCKELLEKED